MHGFWPIAAALLYGAALFLVARRVERRGISRQSSRLAFPLSLAVYFTSWTFFGAVGSATTSGWNYLAIYLGPALVFLMLPAFLARLVRLAKIEGATSIADFISARYGRSRSLAALVALLALLASIPYIALQLRSVSWSFGAIAGIERSPGIGLTVAAVLAAFAITFGARSYEVTGGNRGLIAAVATESAVKLFSLFLLGVTALFLFAGLEAPVRAAGAAALAERFEWRDIGSDFVVQTLLAACAIVCLPRQFYVCVVEAPGPHAVLAGRRAFLFYLALVSLAVVPLALAGLTLLPAETPPDLFVLWLPLAAELDLLALIAFLGGLSASTAMIIVEALALSTMAANDLLAPLLLRSRRVRSEADLGGLLLFIRRLIVALIVMAAFLYSESLGETQTLANIGLIAFAGVAQFAPALVAATAFDFHDPRAARIGLAAGTLIWLYCIFLPSFGDAMLPAAGPFAPTALLGLELGSPLVHGTIWSLGINVALLIGVHFLPSRSRADALADAQLDLGQVRNVGELSSLVGRFVGDEEADQAFVEWSASDAIDAHAARRAERLIAGVIGAPSARLIVTSVLAGGTLSVGDVVRLLDQGGRSLRFSRGLLSATLEAIDPGVSVVDSELRLVAWNPRYREMFDYPDGYVVVGRPIADLIRYNAERGECGPGEVDAHVERRLDHLRRAQPHSFERKRPDGRWIKTVGRPMPGGGYVMSFTDITAEKEAQAELEARVEARTHDLAESNAALAQAKAAAEAATRDKTRFLATASHDLLQPLHAARLFCTALDTEVDEAARPLVRHIDRAIGSADALLKALLDVSKLDAGGITPRPERFALSDLVEELAAEFLPLAAERGLQLRAYGGHALVETDRLLLRSILQNFLSNAVRYTGGGGIFIGARRVGSLVRVEVRDSGPGIAEADQQRVFREFERLETKGSAGGGFGLGLAIVERIARLLQLPVSLRSAPGRGSVFAVTLEVVGRARPHAPEPLPVARRTGPLRVLCLDNDPSILTGLEAALASRGCQAVTALTAGEALERAGEGRPDVALLDFHLGEDVDGLEVAARLRADDPELPIALVSADPAISQDPRVSALSIAVLPKPLDPDRLWAFLGRVLPAAIAPAA